MYSIEALTEYLCENPIYRNCIKPDWINKSKYNKQIHQQKIKAKRLPLNTLLYYLSFAPKFWYPYNMLPRKIE